MVLPKIYDGRGKTYYFGEYQGFRQVLGTTQVFPVPTAAERQGMDTTSFPGDTFMPPIGEGWREDAREEHAAENGRPAFAFVTLRREI